MQPLTFKVESLPKLSMLSKWNKTLHIERKKKKGVADEDNDRHDLLGQMHTTSHNKYIVTAYGIASQMCLNTLDDLAPFAVR